MSNIDRLVAYFSLSLSLKGLTMVKGRGSTTAFKVKGQRQSAEWLNALSQRGEEKKRIMCLLVIITLIEQLSELEREREREGVFTAYEFSTLLNSTAGRGRQ